jgi:hypothetical protein
LIKKDYIKQLLHSKICLEIEEAMHRMGKNLCQLQIQGINNQIMQRAQKTKFPPKSMTQ